MGGSLLLNGFRPSFNGPFCYSGIFKQVLLLFSWGRVVNCSPHLEFMKAARPARSHRRTSAAPSAGVFLSADTPNAAQFRLDPIPVSESGAHDNSLRSVEGVFCAAPIGRGGHIAAVEGSGQCARVLVGA